MIQGVFIVVQRINLYVLDGMRQKMPGTWMDKNAISGATDGIRDFYIEAGRGDSGRLIFT
jgi:hypothetical protein